MPGQHDSRKFKLVGCWIDDVLLTKVNHARGEIGMSQFLRDSIWAKLESQGIEVAREEVIPPDRGGKGGPKPKKISRYRADEQRQLKRKKGGA